MSPFVEILLKLSFVPDNIIQDIEKVSPELAVLCKDAKVLQPKLTAALPHIQAIEPLIYAALALWQKDGASIVKLLPNVEELIEYVVKRGKLGDSKSEGA